MFFRVAVRKTMVEATIIASDRSQFLHFTALVMAWIAIFGLHLDFFGASSIQMGHHKIVRVHTSLESDCLVAYRTFIHHTVKRNCATVVTCLPVVRTEGLSTSSTFVRKKV
jgi:hypothetical protein